MAGNLSKARQLGRYILLCALDLRPADMAAGQEFFDVALVGSVERAKDHTVIALVCLRELEAINCTS